MKRGVSEVLGAVLLSLIAAILGTIIVMFALLYSNTMVNTLSKPKCSFSIVYVLINKDNSNYVLNPIVYNSGNIPCTIVQEILIINGSAVEFKSIKVTVKPYHYKTIDVGLEVSPEVLDHSIITIRLVSSDGTVRDYVLG